MKKTHVGTLTGTADLPLTAVAADRVHTGVHVTFTSQQTDPVEVQVLLKRGTGRYRLHRVEELEAKDSVSLALPQVLEAADQLVLAQSGAGGVDYVAGWIEQAASAAPSPLSLEGVEESIDELKAGLTTAVTEVKDAVTATKEVIEGIRTALTPADGNADAANLTTDFTLTMSWQDVVSVSITPGSEQAKMRLWLTLFWEGEVEYRMLRGSDAIIPAQEAHPQESGTADEPVSFPISDAPASTARQTYKLQARAGSATGTHEVALGTTLVVEELRS